MLDRIMKMLEVPRIDSTNSKAETGYYIKESNGMALSPFDHPNSNSQLYLRPDLLPGTCSYDLLSRTARATVHIVDH